MREKTLKKIGDFFSKNKNLIMYLGGLTLVVHGCMSEGYNKGFERGAILFGKEAEEIHPGICKEIVDNFDKK